MLFHLTQSFYKVKTSINDFNYIMFSKRDSKYHKSYMDDKDEKLKIPKDLRVLVGDAEKVRVAAVKKADEQKSRERKRLKKKW